MLLVQCNTALHKMLRVPKHKLISKKKKKIKGQGVKQFFFSLKSLYSLFQKKERLENIRKQSNHKASSQLLSYNIFVVHWKLFSRLMLLNNQWDHSKTKVLYTQSSASSREPKVGKLIKSVDNGNVSFMINLNFDIQNFIELRSLGIFPKIRSQKKLTKSSTLVFLMGFQKIFMSKATCLILRAANSKTANLQRW